MLGEVRSRSGVPVAGDFRGASPPVVADTLTGHLYTLSTGDIVRDVGSGWIFSVKDPAFGAKGDGLTNDTAAFQAAITASANKALFIPKGTYLVSSGITIASPVYLYGEGFASIIKVDSTAATRFIPILVSTGTGVVLRDFAVDGSLKGELDSGLVQINSAVAFICSGLRVFNGGTPAEASPQGVNGIAVSAGSLGGTAAQGVIENCLIEATTKAGINWTTEAINGSISGNIVRNCTGNGSTPGIQVNGGYNVRVAFNSCYGNEGPGIYVATSGGAGTERSPKHGIYIGNHTYSNGTHGFQWANGTSVNYGRLLIADNVSYSNGTGTTGAGFLCLSDTNAILSGNYAYLNRGSGFHFGSGTQLDYKIHNNVSEANNQGAAALGGGYYFNGTFTRLSFTGNKSLDAQGSPTHNYGLVIDGTSTIADLYMRDNEYYGSVNKPQVNISQTAEITRVNAVIPVEYQTTTATVANVGQMLLPDNSAWQYRVKIVAKKSDASDRAWYDKETLVYRDGGATTRQGAEVVYASIESAAAWDVSTTITGNLAHFSITGAAATTIDWAGEIEVRSL